MSRSRSIVAVLLAVFLLVLPATPALAYGTENWQIGLSGTGIAPATGTGLGFWGWCAFGGGVTSGNTGDCQFAQYIHSSSGSGFTCHISLDITSWDTVPMQPSGTQFRITGTATASPAAVASQCIQFFPMTSSFTDFPTGIPAAANHYNVGSGVLGFPVGEFQIQVTQI